MVLRKEASRARGGGRGDRQRRRGWGLQGALLGAESGETLPTSSRLSPGWAPGRGTGRRHPGSERAGDRAPGAGFRVCFYLAMGGAARTQRFSLRRAVCAQGAPRGAGRAAETQRRGDLAKGVPRQGETQRDREEETTGRRQRQLAVRRRGPDPHTQAVARRAEGSALGTQPQGPPARPALRRGPTRSSLGRASSCGRRAPGPGVNWGRRGALTKVHLLVALGALRHGGWGSGEDVWAGADRRAGLGGSGWERAFQGPQDPAPLTPALRAPPPEPGIWTQGPGFHTNQLRKVIWSNPASGQHPGLADNRAGGRGVWGGSQGARGIPGDALKGRGSSGGCSPAPSLRSRIYGRDSPGSGRRSLSLAPARRHVPGPPDIREPGRDESPLKCK